jgi:hypothetical protein
MDRSRRIGLFVVAFALLATSAVIASRQDPAVPPNTFRSGSHLLLGDVRDARSLPIADLAAGEYALSVSVRVGPQNSERQLRFKVE